MSVVQKTAASNAARDFVIDLRAVGDTTSKFNRVGFLRVVATAGPAASQFFLKAVKVNDGDAVPTAVDLAATYGANTIIDAIKIETSADDTVNTTDTWEFGQRFASGYSEGVYNGNCFTHLLVSCKAQGELQIFGC